MFLFAQVLFAVPLLSDTNTSFLPLQQLYSAVTSGQEEAEAGRICSNRCMNGSSHKLLHLFVGNVPVHSCSLTSLPFLL